MPFEIDYTPLGSVFNLSYQAGLGQYRLAQQEMAQRQALQERALQANLNSQAMAHANNLEEMHLQEQMQNRAAQRQLDLQVRLGQVQNDFQAKAENRKFAQEWALQQAQFANEAVWKQKDVDFKEQQELAANMEKVRLFRQEEMKLIAKGMQYDAKGQADLDAWQAEWDQVKTKNLNPVQQSFAYSELIGRKPLPKAPPAPTPQQMFDQERIEDPATGARYFPIRDENGNVKSLQPLGTLEGDVGGGGAGGGGGASTRATNRGAGNIWTRFMRKANPTDYKSAIQAISNDASAWNDLRNHATERLEEDRQAKIASLGKTLPGADGVGSALTGSSVPEISEADINKRMHDIVKSAFDFNDTKAVEFHDLYKKIGGADKISAKSITVPNKKNMFGYETNQKMSLLEFHDWLKSDTTNIGKKITGLVGPDGTPWDYVWDGDKLWPYEQTKGNPAQAAGQPAPAPGTTPAAPTPGGLGPRRIPREAPQPVPPLTANDIFPVSDGAMTQQPWLSMPSWSDLANAYGMGGGGSMPGTPPIPQAMPQAPQYVPGGPPQYAPGVTMGPDGRLTYNPVPPSQGDYQALPEGMGWYGQHPTTGQQYNATAGLSGDMLRAYSPSGLANYYTALARGFGGWTERQTQAINAKVDKLNRAIESSAPVSKINQLKREVNETAADFNKKSKVDNQTKPLEDAVDKVMGRILNPNS